MKSSGAYFEISEEHNCPMYTIGDRFLVSGRVFSFDSVTEKSFITTSVVQFPEQKEMCKILIGDLNAIFIKYENLDNVNRLTKNCSGCSGVVRIEFKRETGASEHEKKKKPLSRSLFNLDNLGAIASLLYIFPIFQSIDQSDIKDLLPLLKIKKFAKGTIILGKGELCKNLYIVVGGKAEILLDNDMRIGVLERGAVFGEISLLTGSPVNASVRAMEFVTALMVYGKDFQNLLTRFPALQMYLAKVLAERLAESNQNRPESIFSDLSGNLSEMKPSELLQTLNLNHKTGILTFYLSDSEARSYFNEGKLIGAEYNELKGTDAFFEILKFEKGRFSFSQGIPPDKKDAKPLGDFMYLLMEGIRMMDDDSKK